MDLTQKKKDAVLTNDENTTRTPARKYSEEDVELPI